MMPDEIKTKEEFNAKINDAIAKYRKSIDRLETIQLRFSENPTMIAQIQEKIDDLEKVISNLKSYKALQPPKAGATRTVDSGVDAFLVKQAETEIKLGNETVSNAELRNELRKSQERSSRYAILGMLGGGGITLVVGLILAYMFNPKLPSVIFTNGTIIWP